jgi:hypothetical protein
MEFEVEVEVRFSCTIALERRNDRSGNLTDQESDSEPDPDPDPETEEYEYFVPALFYTSEHHKQLERIIFAAKKNRKLNFDGKFRLISIKFEIVSEETFNRLQSVESILTPFNDTYKYKAIGLTCKDADGKPKTYVHPFPKKSIKDTILVQKYKDMYHGFAENVGFCELNEVLDKPNRRHLFHYSTPDHPELRPLPTKQDIKIADLEAEVRSLKTMVLEMQKMITDLIASSNSSKS